MVKMKIYIIESKFDEFGEYTYRYKSLYNGATGNWFDTEQEAGQQGKQHQKIIEKIHPELKDHDETRRKNEMLCR